MVYCLRLPRCVNTTTLLLAVAAQMLIQKLECLMATVWPAVECDVGVLMVVFPGLAKRA
jgi:hypothetical protein